MYTVKGYFTGQNPRTHRVQVDNLVRARVVANELKLKGYAIEIRDQTGKVVYDDQAE